MNNEISGKQTILQNSTPELLFQCSSHVGERERGRLTSGKCCDIVQMNHPLQTLVFLLQLLRKCT